jgi:hypothetical protein
VSETLLAAAAIGAGASLFTSMFVWVLYLLGRSDRHDRQLRALEEARRTDRMLPPPGAGTRAMAAHELRGRLRGRR